MKEAKTYPLGDYHSKANRAVRTGEFRRPRKGEWFLSGAIPTAYKAPNNLSTAYHIMQPVKAKPVTKMIIEERF